MQHQCCGKVKAGSYCNSSSHLQWLHSRHTAHIKTDVTCYYSCRCLNTIIKHTPCTSLSTCRLGANIWNLWSSPITCCCAELLPSGVWRCQNQDTKCTVLMLHELADWGWHYFILCCQKPQKLKSSHCIHNENLLTIITSEKSPSRVTAIRTNIFKEGYQPLSIYSCAKCAKLKTLNILNKRVRAVTHHPQVAICQKSDRASFW